MQTWNVTIFYEKIFYHLSIFQIKSTSCVFALRSYLHESYFWLTLKSYLHKTGPYFYQYGIMVEYSFMN